MKTLSIVACVAWMNAAVVAQLPPQLSWGNYFQPTRLTGISLDPNGGFCQTDMASDGYGHHYVTVVNNQVVYSLLDNSGTVIRSYNFGPNTLHPSITSFFDLGTQLTRQHIILQQGSNLVLFRSTDGGTTWNSLPTLPIQGSLVSIDSYEDLTGIHITYGSSLGIYHHLRNRTPDGWAVLNPFVAALAPPPPPFSYYNFPSVIASSDSAHIYTQQGLYSRRLTENSWTPAQALILNAYWPATLTRTVEDDTEYIRAWIWGEVNPPNSYYGGVTSTRRRLFNAAQWGAADPPSQEAEGELTGWKPQCNNAGSVFRYVYNRAPADGARVYYGDYVVGGFLISEENRASRTPAISSDITGIAVVWWDVPSGTAYLRRRPLGVSDASTGSVVDNYTFSDTTWVTGTLTVAPGKQLRLKSGSVTYLWGPYSGGGPGSLIMSDGSSLVVESNAQFIMNAGSGIVFGPNSSMTVTGLLRVNGTSTQRVTFTRSGSSGTWPGIVIDNYSCAYTSNINYAAISYANTGISTRTDARLAINNTTFDNAAIGIEIIPPGDHAPTTPPPMQINDCKLTNITTTGIFDNGLSTLTLLRDTIISTSSPGPYPSGIVLTSASPKILASRIKNFYYGMRCTNYSSPMLEDGNYAGNNVIKLNTIAVQCDTKSNAVLGFLGGLADQGGMNSIFSNSSYDVQLTNKCVVYAQNNYWQGTKDPPGLFSIDGGSQLTYTPWLSSDPNPWNRPFNGEGKIADGEPRLSPFPIEMQQALAERNHGHYVQALNMLGPIVAAQSQPLFAKEWALAQMLAIAPFIPGARLSEYLCTILTGNPELAMTIHGIGPFACLQEGLNTQALATFDANIQQYPNSELERAALYGKFVHTVYDLGDPGVANSLLQQLEARYPGSAEAIVGRSQYRNHLPLAPTSPLLKNGVPETPEPSGFSLGQNYPNPFNPSTTINYGVPRDARASVKVYDILGREVATLVDDMVAAGYHQVTFNAVGLASGVYFARLAVTNAQGSVAYTKVNKLLLVR